jgi:hypothetical protein
VETTGLIEYHLETIPWHVLPLLLVSSLLLLATPLLVASLLPFAAVGFKLILSYNSHVPRAIPPVEEIFSSLVSDPEILAVIPPGSFMNWVS